MPDTGARPSAAYRRDVRAGLRRSDTWIQLVRFVVVGASGAVANIGTYAIAVHVLGLDFRVAAVVALVAGVGNNFVWHRVWTFGARDGHFGFQATRFVIVYVVTFFVSLGLLQLFVSSGLSKVLGYAIAQVLITPLNFLGHKLWSFRDG